MFQMPEEKIKACRAIFNLFDIDKSGTIDSNELRKIMKVLGIHFTQSEIEEMVRLLDEDKSGTIDFDEFVKIFEQKLLEPDTFTDLYDSFKVFDYNCKGSFSVKEIEKIMMNYGDKMTQEEVNDFLENAPQNENGEIDYKEFARILSEKISSHENSHIKENDPLNALSDLNDYQDEEDEDDDSQSKN